jgi:aminoglycoside 2''-phosphotransferase
MDDLNDSEKAIQRLQAIRIACPELEVRSARQFGAGGQYNYALLVNETHLFRFPRHPEWIAHLSREVALLLKIRPYLSLPVPEPVCWSLDSPTVEGIFMGYRLIPGQPLYQEILEAIDDPGIVKSLAVQLAGFLKELHAIPLGAAGLGAGVRDGPQDWQSLYAEFRLHLFPFMQAQVRAAVERQVHDYLSDASLHTFQPAIRHGDFGGSNILYDPSPGRISGVIDFSFAGPGDPALDLAAVSTYGETFFSLILDEYPAGPAILKRANFYRSTFALEEALYGKKTGDQEAFERGMAGYR